MAIYKHTCDRCGKEFYCTGIGCISPNENLFRCSCIKCSIKQRKEGYTISIEECNKADSYEHLISIVL